MRWFSLNQLMLFMCLQSVPLSCFMYDVDCISMIMCIDCISELYNVWLPIVPKACYAIQVTQKASSGNESDLIGSTQNYSGVREGY